jgi:arylsulfatase A-like enzyme
LRWPGIAPRRFRSLCYQVDVGATVIELLGGEVPGVWDGRSVAAALRCSADVARTELVITQGAWTCQRALRWDRWIAIHTLHDGYHAFPEWMLFDLEDDPHEQADLAERFPELISMASRKLRQWESAALQRNRVGVDPLTTVLLEGGPSHTRGKLAVYVERLRATGRAAWAERLISAHPSELVS